jgi:hypothetical protein
MLVYLIRVIGASKIASTYTLPTIENIMIAMTGTAKDLLTRGNETTMAVLGMTSIIAAICHKIGSMFHYVLTENENRNVGGPENDEEKSVSNKCWVDPRIRDLCLPLQNKTLSKVLSISHSFFRLALYPRCCSLFW